MMNGKIKKLIKTIFEYTIEDEYRVLRLRHTPFTYRISLTRSACRRYAGKPVIPDMVVFHNYMGSGYGCNCKYVTEELLKRNADLRIVWIVKDVEANRQQFPEGIELVEYGTLEALQTYFTAGVWVCNYHLNAYWNMGLEKRPGQTYIQMWHGSLGIKKLERDGDLFRDMPAWGYLAKKNSQNTDYWISNSTFETDVYQSAFWDVKNIRLLGHPRNDIFFADDKEALCARIRDRLGVGQDKALVLYVPTYRDSGVFPAERIVADRLLDALKRRFGGEWELLVRKHPRMKQDIDTVVQTGAESPFDVTAYADIQELLVCADVVITDYSSCIFDYLFTHRPGFVYAPDLEIYNTERGFYYPMEQTPFPIATTMDELEYNITAFDADQYLQEADTFIQGKGCMENGHAADAVADLVLEVVTQGVKEQSEGKHG